MENCFMQTTKRKKKHNWNHLQWSKTESTFFKIKQRYSLLSLLFKIALEVLAGAISEEDIKCVQLERE